MADIREESFERWWLKAREKFSPDIATRVTAQEAWDEAWEAGRRAVLAESLDTMVSVTEAPEKTLPFPLTNCRTGRTRSQPTTEELAQRDWDKAVAEMREASKLAKRHGLAITSATQGGKNNVQAYRPLKGVVAETETWPEMLRVLKTLEKEGKL